MDYGHYNTRVDNNSTGINKTILAAPRSWIVTLPSTLSAAPSATAGESVTVDADIVFAATKGFVELRMTEDTAELVGEINGDNADSLRDKLTLTGFMPGLTADRIELAQQAKNDDWILLVKDCGQTFLIGCDCAPVQAKAALSTGKVSGGAKGHNWTFDAFCGLKLYTGAIQMKP
jgi:hypothetical protein